MLQAQALALLIPAAPGQDMDAANTYLSRRPLHAGAGSNLRKLARAQRIAARLRPLTMSRQKETVVSEHDGFAIIDTHELHPTKGWRNQRRSKRRGA